jgi:hypothetical protein
MIRKDGVFTIYIIKHLYEKQEKEWSGSGDCGQWLGHKMKDYPTIDSYKEFRNKYKDLFNHLNAIGDCWQETGVNGTYNREVAIEICNLISSWFPQHSFKVCKVEIKQKTTDVAVFNV